MIFDTTIDGIPAQCEVTHYSKPLPMRVTGWGFGDADPPDPGSFEYRILDRRGRHAPWLEAKVTEADEQRLISEYKQEIENDF